jgi:glycosyltransferase 2 family protein
MSWLKTFIWKQWKTLLTIITFGAFAGIIYVSREQIGQTFSNLAYVHAWVLLLMLVWQAFNYNAYTRMYQHYFKIFKTDITFKDMLKITSEMNFVNNIFPTAGVSGFSYFGLRMREYSVSAGTATTIQLMRFVSVFVSFQVLLVLGLLFLAIGGKASNLVILIASSLTTLLGVGTLVTVYIVSSKRRINGFMVFLAKIINWLLHNTRLAGKEVIRLDKVEEVFGELHDNYVLMRRKRRELKWPLFHAFIANLSEILTIYTVYIAFDQWVNFGAVIIAYAIANFAGLVSVLPGGVGIYEGLTTATLIAAGVPPAVSIPVVIMYRILSMLIQLPIGYYLYHKQISRA